MNACLRTLGIAGAALLLLGADAGTPGGVAPTNDRTIPDQAARVG